jgi:hypothetical protein
MVLEGEITVLRRDTKEMAADEGTGEVRLTKHWNADRGSRTPSTSTAASWTCIVLKEDATLD